MMAYRSPGAGSWGAKTPGLACWGCALAKPWGRVATAAGPQGVDGPQDTAHAQLLMQSSAAPVLLLPAHKRLSRVRIVRSMRVHVMVL